MIFDYCFLFFTVFCVFAQNPTKETFVKRFFGLFKNFKDN